VKEPRGADARLRCRIVGKQLVISIGIDTLAHALRVGPVGGEITRDDEHPDGWDESKLRVTDPAVFAKEVVHALMDEAEDGSSPVTNLLDRAFRDAIENGAEGIYIRGELD
jgi:hypothetical protein